jgi:multidrug efflux pump subunit AcrB
LYLDDNFGYALGIAVVCGLLFSTFLTLYVIPALYSFLSKEGKNEEN